MEKEIIGGEEIAPAPKKLDNKENIEHKHEKKHKQKKNKKNYWPLIVVFLSLTISFLVSIGCEFLLSGTGIVICTILLLLVIVISIITDMIGVALTSADLEPFNVMAARKFFGAKAAIKLVKKADRFASLFCDVIGDICGIISGSICATFVVMMGLAGGVVEIVVSALVSGLIAALMIGGKAMGKRIAIKNNVFIISKFASFMAIFGYGKKK